MSESGIDMSFDLDAGHDRGADRTSHVISKASNSAGPRTPLASKHRHKMRFQAKLMLLKQQHEQAQEAQKTSRKLSSSASASSLKNLSLPQLAEGAGIAGLPGEGHSVPTNILKYPAINSSNRRSKGSICEASPVFGSSPLTSEAQMKFNLLKASFTSDTGYPDNGSPTSSTTSISEISDVDPFSFGNVVEVKPVDEIPDDLSQFLSPASYNEGLTELISTGNFKPTKEISSSCPAETAPQPKYRGGRKKEAPPPNMTPEQQVMWDKERQKKDNHNHIERKRRDKINDCIRTLAQIVPSDDDNVEYNRKGAVLEKSVKYIKHLQNGQKQLEEMKKQQELLQRINRSLMLEIQELQRQAQQVHLSSPPQMQHQQQQVIIHQYQQPIVQQASLGQEPMQHVEMHLASVPQHSQTLLTSNHHQPVEIHQQDSQQLIVDGFASFLPQASISDDATLATVDDHFGENQFATISELICLSQPVEATYPELSIMDHTFSDTTTFDDMLFGTNSLQLNGDPLLSNATTEPMVSDFDEPFVSLALR